MHVPTRSLPCRRLQGIYYTYTKGAAYLSLCKENVALHDVEGGPCFDAEVVSGGGLQCLLGCRWPTLTHKYASLHIIEALKTLVTACTSPVYSLVFRPGVSQLLYVCTLLSPEEGNANKQM